MGWPEGTVQCCGDVRYRTVGGEGVIIRMEAGEAIVVNELGARILELLQTSRRFEEVVQILEEEYDVSRETLQHDTMLFVQQLADFGVIENGIS